MGYKKFYPDLISRCEQCKQYDFAAFLLQHENFVQSPKSTKKYPVLVDPLNGFHYLIKKNPNNGSQFQGFITEDVFPDGTTNFQKKHFTLVDYIMQRYRLELGEAVEHIESKCGTGKLIFTATHHPVMPSKKTKQYTADPTLLTPYTDTRFLSDIRKIDRQILKEPFLKNALRQIAITRHTNTVFPMKNEKGIVLNWCEKNAIAQADGSYKSWNSFPEGTTNGLLFVSDVPGKVDYVLFSEAPIDAISYYQINHLALKSNTLIVSSCGNINTDMLTHLNSILDKYPSAKLLVANDFDAAGFRFDFMIASACRSHFSSADDVQALFHAIKPSAIGENFFKCSFTCHQLEPLQSYLVSLSTFANNKLLSYTFSPVETVISGNDTTHLFTLQFSFDLRHSKLLLDHYCDHFALRDTMLFDKPLRGFRDWNECLCSGNALPSPQLSTFLQTGSTQLEAPVEETKKKMIKR